MIPLGSCTMKLNATTEMIPVTWPEFGSSSVCPTQIRRRVSRNVWTAGRMAGDITGYDAVRCSRTPARRANMPVAGDPRLSRRARRPHARCPDPLLAHGTNPASASMVGMEVVVIACDARGNVDVEDLRRQGGAASETLAAMMITYPSTHGVFEEHIRDICESFTAMADRSISTAPI